MPKRRSRKSRYNRRKQLRVLARGLAVLATAIAEDIAEEEQQQQQIKKRPPVVTDDSDDSDV